MNSLLETHSEREIFQYLMKSTLLLIRIMSITQGESTNQMLAVPQVQSTH